jgi:hypothetical protein
MNPIIFWNGCRKTLPARFPMGEKYFAEERENDIFPIMSGKMWSKLFYVGIVQRMD